MSDDLDPTFRLEPIDRVTMRFVAVQRYDALVERVELQATELADLRRCLEVAEASSFSSRDTSENLRAELVGKDRELQQLRDELAKAQSWIFHLEGGIDDEILER